MIRVSFSNLDEIREVYDPEIVRRAAKDATRRLGRQAATQVSKAVRKRYDIRAGEIKSALANRSRYRSGIDESVLIYTSGRLSLSRFATGKGAPSRSNRPKIRSSRGIRYGAKVRMIKGRPAKTVRGAFWGRARAGRSDEGLGQGAWQIWVREGLSRNSIRRLTGPGVAQMVRSNSAIAAVNDSVDSMADKILADRLNFYSGRKAGVL